MPAAARQSHRGTSKIHGDKSHGSPQTLTRSCYAVTSLTVTQATPARLAAIIDGHRGIEDRLHWVRDLDFDEDRSQVRTAAGPQIMASLRTS